MAKIEINEKKILGHINPGIQGQFSEHLGRGIYEGIFVKEDSGIPNKNGAKGRGGGTPGHTRTAPSLARRVLCR